MHTLDEAIAFRTYRVQRLLRLHLVGTLDQVRPGHPRPGLKFQGVRRA